MSPGQQRVVIIGCGVVGAAIAYELSQDPTLEIHVLDRQPPAQASTGAALGVLMGIISHKVAGRTWRLREASIQRYSTLIPELIAATGRAIASNQQGILSLWFDPAERQGWQQLQRDRQAQGWPLEIWERDRLATTCPYLNLDPVVAATYSPRDGQVHPIELTHSLIQAAKQRGVTFTFNVGVTALDQSPQTPEQCRGVQTNQGAIAADWVVLAAGLGSTAILPALNRPLTLQPVLGQAMRLHLPHPLGNPAFQPVVNGQDIHILPLGQGDYWVGATVEFPSEEAVVTGLELEPMADRLDAVRQGAIALCPALARADVVTTWHGIRPRPQGQAAPVLQWADPLRNVYLATGHYRNGVLLAPASAEMVRAAIAARRLEHP